jgi:hypothetical protein
LEQEYYECLDRDNVDVVDLKANPIKEFTETGIISEYETEREFDTVVIATGFHSMTGSLTNMNIPGKKREQLNYLGGVNNYEMECRQAVESLEGLTVVRQ